MYLTGNNAMCPAIAANQMLVYGNGVVLVNPFSGIGPFFDIEEFRFLDETGTTMELFTIGESFVGRGPGTLFLSDQLAFFTNNPIATDIIAAKATARPLLTQVQVRPDMSGGQPVSILDVNDGNFTMTLTGSPTKILAFTFDNRIIYSDSTLRVEQGVLRRTEYPDIFTFAVLRRVAGTTDRQYSVFSMSTTDVILGPGQVYVSLRENKAFFVEDFLFRDSEGGDVIGIINTQIFRQSFSVEDIDGAVIVRDGINNELVTLSVNTSKLELPDAAEVTYIGLEETATFRDRGGRITTFYGITMFAIFDNSTLGMFTPMSGTTFLLCSGGTIFIDSYQMTAIFISSTNPVVISEFCDVIPTVSGIGYTYDITVNGDYVRLLSVTRRNVTTTPVTKNEPMVILTVTGLYITTLNESEAVTFTNNEIFVKDFFDNTITRIGQVDRLFVNTENIPFKSFENVAPIPFSGPGTLSYSRGSAFFTTNQALGRELALQTRTAPIPDIDFERVTLRVNTIDGVNYNESVLIQNIGGDRVVTFEATSYTTSSEQEILYSGDLVTVHTPMRAGAGNVTYMSDLQTVVYTDTNGEEQELVNVDRFYEFNGGSVREFPPPDVVTISGPGKIYVSEDGTDVLFSTSNIITADVAAIIRQGVSDFSVDADQFSSVFGGVFNLSTDSATVTYTGGGVIWSSTFNGSRESLYINNESVRNRIRRDVSIILSLMKSEPVKDQGFIHIIFNGRSLYSYRPIMGNSDILVRRNEFVVFNGSALTGLAVGPLAGINSIITYDGIEVKTFDSSDAPVELNGYGMLLVQSNSDTVFFTTLVATINYLLQAIKNLEDFLIAPVLEAPSGSGRITTKKRADVVRFGTDVRAFAGASITFNCEIRRGRPKPSVEFSRVFENGTSITLNDSQMGVTITNTSLTINSISNNDTGRYTCTADNNVPPVAVAESTLTVSKAGMQYMVQNFDEHRGKQLKSRLIDNNNYM